MLLADLRRDGCDTAHRTRPPELDPATRRPRPQVLRELPRLDQDAQDAQGNYSNAAAETAIGWLQDAGEYTAERGFCTTSTPAAQRACAATAPLWADITVALAKTTTQPPANSWKNSTHACRVTTVSTLPSPYTTPAERKRLLLKRQTPSTTTNLCTCN